MADVISRLRLESGEFDSKIKRAGQELLAYSEHCRKMGLEMGYANRDAKEFAKQLGSMATVSTTARGKINELSEAFVNAKVMYKNMTDEEKKGEFGKNLAASLDQLKSRLNSAKQDLADVNKELAGGGKFGEFGNVLDTLGSKMGVTGNLTEMLTSKTALLTGAVGAGIAIVTKATEAWAGYNSELAKQDQITTVTTGLKGDDADRMTDKMRALSDTYNVDFREAVNAANTLMTQFGKTGDEATQLIKDGMQGMIQGDGPKLLSMIQQYAPAFRDAGVSASQLVAVIQNSEGGIFTDQNMNAIVMGIKNIRLMTDATSQALAKMGIDGEKMSQQLSNGTLTIFDALKQVSHQLQTVDSNSKTAGEVMQQVFGRQGVTAGTNLAKAIETLNTDLEQTKKQTGEVGKAFNDLQEANERLNTAIRDAFGYDGWDKMATGIKTKLVGALSDVIEHLAIIEEGFGKLFGRGNDKPKPQKEADTSKFGSYQVTTDSDGNVLKATKWNRGKAIDMTDYERTQQGYTVTGNMSKSGSKGGKRGKSGIQEDKDEFVEIIGLVGQAQERVSDLQKRMRESWDQNEIATLRKQLKEAQNELDVLQGKLPKDSVVELTITANTSEALQKVKEIDGVTIDPKAMTVTANTSEALQKVKEIDGVTIDPKTMTITANTSEALQKVQELVADVGGKVVNVKVVPVLTDADIDKQLQKQYGKAIQVPIIPKLTAGEKLEMEVRTKLSDSNIETDMQTLRTLLETQIKNGIEGIDIPTDALMDQIIGEGMDIPDEYWQNLQDQINAKLAEMEIDPINIDFKTGESSKEEKKEPKELTEFKEFNQKAGQFISGLQSVSSGLKGLGIQLPAGVDQLISAMSSVMQILQGVQSIISVFSTGAMAANTAAVIANTVALYANTFTPSLFANGGIIHAANGWAGTIPGNSYSGDNIPIMANAGELVLNKAQQGNLASQLENGGLHNLQLETRIDSEELIIMINNNGMRRGLGKLING